MLAVEGTGGNAVANKIRHTKKQNQMNNTYESLASHIIAQRSMQPQNYMKYLIQNIRCILILIIFPRTQIARFVFVIFKDAKLNGV